MAVWDGDAAHRLHGGPAPHRLPQLRRRDAAMPRDKVRIVCKFIGGGFGGKLADRVRRHPRGAGGAPARPPGQGGDDPPADLRQCRPPHRIAAARAAGRDRDGRLMALAHDAHRRTPPLSTNSPSRRSTRRATSMRPPTGSPPIGWSSSTCRCRATCARRARPSACSPSRRRWTNSPMPSTSIPSNCASATSRRCIPRPASRSRPASWSTATAKAPGCSAGSAGLPRPATLRDGRCLVGYGMAASIRSNFMAPSQGRATLSPDGRLTVQTAMTDIGTGTYTILTQIAAETHGHAGRARHRRDRRQRPAAIAGLRRIVGCGQFRQRHLQCLHGAARQDGGGGRAERSGADRHRRRHGVGRRPRPAARSLHGGICAVRAASRRPAHARQGNARTIRRTPMARSSPRSASTGISGEARLRRMLGVFTAGRILNARTARSQAIGGLIWGLGSALHEETVVDERYRQVPQRRPRRLSRAGPCRRGRGGGHFPARNGRQVEPLEVKGIGELGICGAGAAVANAIYNACGVRVRSYPITLDKLILDAGFPA